MPRIHVENNITCYNDIMTMPRIGNRRIRELMVEQNVIDAINQFKSEHPDFEGYTTYYMFGVLNNCRSIEAVLSTVPLCPTCGKKRCLVDWKYTKWSEPIQFNQFCNDPDCKSKVVSKKLSDSYQTKTDEQKAIQQEHRLRNWRNRTDEEKKAFSEKMSRIENAFTDEQKQAKIEAFRVSMNSKSDEEFQAIRQRQRDGRNNRSEEEKAAWREKERISALNRSPEAEKLRVTQMKATKAAKSDEEKAAEMVKWKASMANRRSTLKEG